MRRPFSHQDGRHFLQTDALSSPNFEISSVHILGVLIRLLVHIRQKKKLTLEIAAILAINLKLFAYTYIKGVRKNAVAMFQIFTQLIISGRRNLI